VALNKFFGYPSAINRAGGNVRVLETKNTVHGPEDRAVRRTGQVEPEARLDAGAAYASLDDKIGVGDIYVAALGARPDDGFTPHPPLTAPNLARGRWGEYGAAALDGKSIWIAAPPTLPG
jgi:hypothetical protein